MANGYFERGEIYRIRSTDSFGCEQSAFRPGLIVSGDIGNRLSPVVQIAYLTTKDHSDHLNIEVTATGRRSFVICNQIMTVDKRRLGDLMGVLNAAEMRKIDDALEEVFDLGYADDEELAAKDREISDRDVLIAEKDVEIAKLREAVAAATKRAEDIELSCKVENAMWQKLYDKVLNQLVDMKYTADLSRKETKVVPVITMADPVKEEAVVEKQPELEEVVDERLDINSCTITALKKLGFSLGLARQIVDRRPYSKVEDLKSVPGMKATQYRIMEPKLCCVPVQRSGLAEPDTGCEEPEVVEVPGAVEPTKVNVNTATWNELQQLAGLSKATAQNIVAYRNKHGKFENLEALTQVSRFGQTCLLKYGPKLEV